MSIVTLAEDQSSGTSSRHGPKAMTAVAAVLAAGLSVFGSAAPAAAQGAKPNILFIMGDDIGWMQPSIYHEGWRSEKRPTSTASGMKAQSS